MDGTVGNVMHTPSVSDQKKKKQHNIMDQKMNEFEFRRQAVTSKLQRIQLVLDKPEEITVHHLDTYLRRVDACYDEFNILQNEIYATFPDQRVQQEKQFIEFEQLYEGIRVAICSAVEAYRMQQVAAVRPRLADAAVAGEQQPVIVNQPAGLPAVPLPTFDGTYERWFRFKQLFQDLMQKHPGLSDATKLHYLTQSLKGKAENVISEQILNENNFQAAWNLLEERFENKRTIIDIHVGGLLNLKKMNKECSSDLRQLVEECSRHVEALEFHDQHMEGMSEQLVVSLLTSKLDKATLSLWESTITPKELPDYTDTMQFLRNRCFVLERCEADTHLFCEMTLPERIAMVKEKQLCFNCLKRGHRVGQCKSRVCTVAGCGRKHHTQLHSEVPVPAEKAAEGSVPETKKEPPTQPEQTTSAVTCTSFTGKSVQPNKNEVILSTAVVQRTAAEVKSSCNESSWSLEFLIVPQVTGVLPLQKPCPT
ncbi:uncharacterized protein LOC134289505 [Aedes albopictus]|uniref:CCHC-type domain-containing protein n=1 Tax=Aedes albopictus TaxID=7160 RepID=A0ABM1YLN5_AEDAL